MGYSSSARWFGLALFLASRLAIAGDHASALSQAIGANPPQPIVTVLPASNGAAVVASGTNASLSLGQVAFYGGRPAAGVTQERSGSSLIVATQFDLKVSCASASRVFWAEVSVSLSSSEASRPVRMDGVTISSAPVLTELPCGSVTGHRLEIEVSNTAPPGPFDAALSFAVINTR